MRPCFTPNASLNTRVPTGHDLRPEAWVSVHRLDASDETIEGTFDVNEDQVKK